MSLPKLVVLISGSGSNLQAFIDSASDGSLGGEVAAVISNRPNVLGLERAERAGIPAEVVDHTEFDSREAFDHALAECIDHHQPDIIIMAGFMRILTAQFIRRYQGRMLNIHPSLLPKYPGLHTHQRAIDAGDSEAGATVHFVTEELDGGPPVLQARVPIEAGDSSDDLAKRVLAYEHQIYPLAASWLCSGRLKMDGNRALLDGEPLPETGYPYQPNV
ncbi:phosphoribosylglycinamide formyltransferase [Porticoccus sp. W117]|uniref:phosphoribosylglycinamide formyltransferase n=1 Tax=Porticoccus sp. W117 TaxID=3054777 RepID=UPI002597204A|nr:phosphoribosylglycinamide formyltransferase [Porticoccus sp. W117]MDM3870081.1 phosphoribosylglycinamide formyltransferase [Porticoccus sp. W117]